MVKPKCLVFAAPFGFGPAAKTIRIVRSLHDIFDCILGSVDVHLSQSIVAAIEMKAEKLVSVLQ